MNEQDKWIETKFLVWPVFIGEKCIVTQILLNERITSVIPVILPLPCIFQCVDSASRWAYTVCASDYQSLSSSTLGGGDHLNMSRPDTTSLSNLSLIKPNQDSILRHGRYLQENHQDHSCQCNNSSVTQSFITGLGYCIGRKKNPLWIL